MNHLKTRVPYPQRAIEAARVETALISTYRIHQLARLGTGAEYPSTWSPHPARASAPCRYSPSGYEGYYLGLTVDAALDEASYYHGCDVEQQGLAGSVLLVLRTFFTDLLYLAPVIDAVWEILEFAPMPCWEMYARIMDHSSDNEYTNMIGTWAREQGFKGLVFPSARFSQRELLEVSNCDHFPLLNFTEMGTHLCESGLAVMQTIQRVSTGINPERPLRSPIPICSEPNVVIFDHEVLDGSRTPVFYRTYEIQESASVRMLDDRETLKHRLECRLGRDQGTVYVNSPTYSYVHQFPISNEQPS